MASTGGIFRPRWLQPPPPQNPALVLTHQIPRTATAAYTEADDSLAATAAVAVKGAAAITEADDTLVGTATVAISATAAITEGDDTLAATGTVAGEITGSVAYTEAGDTLAATAAVAIAGSVAFTEDGDSLQAVAHGPIGGGDSGHQREGDWWRSPPRKKRRKAKDTDEGAPSEAPLSISEEAQRQAEEAQQASLREVAARNAHTVMTAEQARQRRLAIMADDELVLLLAA